MAEEPYGRVLRQLLDETPRQKFPGESWDCAGPLSFEERIPFFVDGWRSCSDGTHLSARVLKRRDETAVREPLPHRCFSYAGAPVHYERADTSAGARTQVPRLMGAMNSYLRSGDCEMLPTAFSLAGALTPVALNRLLESQPGLADKVPSLLLLAPVLYGVTETYVAAVKSELGADGTRFVDPSFGLLLEELRPRDGGFCDVARRSVGALVAAGVDVCVIFAEDDGVSPYEPGGLGPAVREVPIASAALAKHDDAIFRHFAMAIRDAPLDAILTEFAEAGF